ncbi:MAG: YIP1 family protein [Rubrobacteraceae bacterium]
MRGGHGMKSPEDFRGALREVWFAPGRFFGRLDPDGGPIRPTIFASLVLYINLIFDALLQAIWLQELSYALIYAPLLGLVVAVILVPTMLSMLTALILVVLDGGPSRMKFAPVYRALGYASGIGIIAWVPYGPLLAIPYGAYVATVAVKEILNESWRKAALATLMPLGAVILIVVILAGQSEGYQFLTNPPGS